MTSSQSAWQRSCTLSEPPQVLTANISAIGLHRAPLLEIEAKGTSPEAARSLVQAYVDELPDFARSVEKNAGCARVLFLSGLRGRLGSPEVPMASCRGSRFCLSRWGSGRAALVYLIRNRRRHPTVRNIGALRNAMPASLVEEVGDDSSDLLRIQALLFAAPNSARSGYICRREAVRWA